MDLIRNEMTSNEFVELTKSSNYYSEYLKFVEERKPRGAKKQKGFEIHHIIPRCFGGSNTDENLVKLTPKEHILVHYYLALMTNHVHMFHAFNYMIGNRFEKLSQIEQFELEELEYWGYIRDISHTRKFSEKARRTISEKAKSRWEKWRQSGEINSIKQNISTATRNAMQRNETKIKVRANLGCKIYYNPVTDVEMHWYEGDPIPTDPWVRGRRGNSQKSREKLSKTLQVKKKRWYYNDELQINKTFNVDDEIPPGWKLGQPKKYKGNYTKLKKQKSIDILISLKQTKQ